MSSLLRVLVFGTALVSLVPARDERQEASFVCPPCGAECHFTTYAKAGACGGCGMQLVPLGSVPQVGVLVFPDAQPAGALAVLAAFASSSAVRAFTVADTDEPLRLGDALELRPQFALAKAPPLDVLVVPDGYGAWDDELIVAWVKQAATHARAVIAIGSGSIVLARAGFLAGERVPATRFLAERGQALAPDLTFDATLAAHRAGKFLLARTAHEALDASLTTLAELDGVERARRTAEGLGHPWEPEPK